MSHYHAVVWIDHKEAHVLHFTREGAENAVVHAHPKHRQTHHRKGVIGSGKAPEDREFFDNVATSLAGAAEILIVGPAQAGQEFAKYLEKHASDLAGKVLAVEAADHPGDGELLKLARHFFVGADRMRTQPGTRPN
jgi:stalled ribosome rescue protein Dom34